MLTQKSLALIRAALQYFDEEMSPNGLEAMRLYFDPPLDEEVTAEEVAELREQLRHCELRYLCCNLAATHVLRDELISDPDTARQIAAVLAGRLVTVVVTTRP